MTENEAKEYMEDEIRCIQRATYCDRDCAKCPLVKEEKPLLEAFGMAVIALEEIQQYRAIGTVEECRNAVERMKPKKPKSKTIKVEIYNAGGFTRDKKISVCGSCRNELLGCSRFCDKCGQKLDWSE